jgi:hypothetical protein
MMDLQMIYISKLAGCENSTQARNIKFEPLPNIEGLLMQSAIGLFEKFVKNVKFENAL